MSKPSAETFLDLLRRSGLLEPETLSRFLAEEKRPGDGTSTADVDALADRLVEAGLLSHWQAAKLLEGRHRGFFLGKYKLVDLLGMGGMSNVYLAEHVLLQRRVALKILPAQRVQDTSYLARFHREAQAAASLSHRNIVRAFDVDNDGDLHYLAMEYVEGRDLKRIVSEDGPLGYSEAVDYIRQAAEGLAHAHAAGLIHRDIKPANLLVDQNNVIKILDLGLARFTSDEDRASLTVAFDENVLGTADYLAPEQGIDSHGADHRADIYSLGCSLFFLLAGHPPYPEGTLPQRIMAHQNQAIPSIRNDRVDVSEDLVQIIVKMMAKKPDDRYESAAELARVLEHWLNKHGWPSPSGKQPESLPRVVIAASHPPQPAGGDSGPDRRCGASGAGTGTPMGGEARSLPSDSTAVVSPLGGAGSSSGRLSQGGSSTRAKHGVAPPAKPAPPRSSVPRGAAPSPASSGLPFVPDEASIYRSRGKRARTSEELDAYQSHRRDESPRWIWYVIGGGVVLAIILALAMALS